MRTLVSWQFAMIAVACCLAQPAVAQNTALTSAEVEQHIQHVTSGLIGGVVIKGDEHATHTLADRMNDLKVPGVSIAVIHQGKIEWARGFGVRSVGGPPVTADTMFQAGSISKPLAAMAALRLVQARKALARQRRKHLPHQLEVAQRSGYSGQAHHSPRTVDTHRRDDSARLPRLCEQ